MYGFPNSCVSYYHFYPLTNYLHICIFSHFGSTLRPIYCVAHHTQTCSLIRNRNNIAECFRFSVFSYAPLPLQPYIQSHHLQNPTFKVFFSHFHRLLCDDLCSFYIAHTVLYRASKAVAYIISFGMLSPFSKFKIYALLATSKKMVNSVIAVNSVLFGRIDFDRMSRKFLFFKILLHFRILIMSSVFFSIHPKRQ